MNAPPETTTNTADGEPLHTTCHATITALRANLDQALRDRDTRATADEHIGQAIRRLTQPGAKRKTIRTSELRAIVDDADRDQRATQATCGHCLGDPPTNHQCPACGRTA